MLTDVSLRNGISAKTGFDLTVGEKKPVRFGLAWPDNFIFNGDN